MRPRQGNVYIWTAHKIRICIFLGVSSDITSDGPRLPVVLVVNITSGPPASARIKIRFSPATGKRRQPLEWTKSTLFMFNPWHRCHKNRSGGCSQPWTKNDRSSHQKSVGPFSNRSRTESFSDFAQNNRSRFARSVSYSSAYCALLLAIPASKPQEDHGLC